MSLTIRPFVEADYPVVAAIWSEVMQEPISVAAFRWQDEQVHVEGHRGRLVAEVGGAIVGYASYTQPRTFFQPGRFEIDLLVLPAHRRQGIGTALYQRLMAVLAAYGEVALTCATNEAWPESVRFAEGRGFVEKMRNWESHLAVQEFDPALWQGVAAQVAEAGYVVRPWAEVAGEPDAARRLHELVTEVRRDVPTTDPWQDVAFADWAKMFEHPDFWPEGYFIGMKDGEWVGVSVLWKSDAPGVVTTGLTAVRRAHRGSGIAKGMKLRAIAFAKEQGCSTLKTWNESNNHRMLAINERLGFVRKPGWIYFTK